MSDIGDELAEINGIKPATLLKDGEETSFQSLTARPNAKPYKIKRLGTTISCSCPAWRNQKKFVDERTCKHLKAFLGDAYEEARTDEATQLIQKGGKSKSKAKPDSKKPTSSGKRKREPEDKGEKSVDEADADPVANAGVDDEDDPDADPIAKINGISPKVVLIDGQEQEVSSQTSSSKYRVKRTGDHYYCTCPAWRNQANAPVNARSCKHLKSILGDEYEDARVEMMNPGGSPDSSTAKGKSSTSSKKAKPDSKKPTSINKRKREPEDEGEKSADEEDAAPATVGVDDEEDPDADPLAKINGISPKVVLLDGQEQEVSSQTSSAKYRVKRTGDHYYCTCPAWRMQASAPVNARSCKHLKSILGDEYEDARIEMMNPGGSPGSSTAKGKGSTSSKKAKVTKNKAPELLLANKWDIESGPDPTGWWASEKLDGVRAYFDGSVFLSRLGNEFSVPQNLIDLLPKDTKLDGELFGGRGKFNETVSIVRSSRSKKWSEGVVTFQIFDILSMDNKTTFEDRFGKLKELFGPKGKYESDFVVLVENTLVKSREHVFELLKDVEDLGGEGLMLRKPGSLYEGHRSSTLLKIKTFYDAEAEVTGYEPGKGKHKGSTGALKCKMESGKTFRVGTGLSDAQRRNPPKIGAIVNYRFQELTPDGVPRFPSYIGEAIDKTEAKDADVPSSRKDGGKSDDV